MADRSAALLVKRRCDRCWRDLFLVGAVGHRQSYLLRGTGADGIHRKAIDVVPWDTLGCRVARSSAVVDGPTPCLGPPPASCGRRRAARDTGPVLPCGVVAVWYCVI